MDSSLESSLWKLKLKIERPEYLVSTMKVVCALFLTFS
nr:MAG TPA: hypothetical protein [Caudoviricetes sp.]